MKKNFLWNMVGATIYSFISLFLAIIITRINGIDDAGIFTFTFSVACILYVVGIYYGRAYQVTDNEYSDAVFINNRIFTCLIMIAIAVVLSIVFRFSVYKSLALFLLTFYKLLEAFSESIYAIIQKKDKLHLVGKSMVIKTLISVAAFLLVDYFTVNMLLSILSIIIINLIIIVFYDLKNANISSLDKFDKKSNSQLLKLGFNTFAFTLLSIFVVNSSKYGMGFQPDELQGIFGIIIMPATVMSLFSQFIIHPYINMLNKHYKAKEYAKFKTMVYKMVIATAVIIIVCAIIASIIGIPILQIIYGIDLKQYHTAFILIMTGSLFYGLSTLISYILIVMRKTFVQLAILLITSIFSIVITYLLVYNYIITGASISYLLTMLFEFILYITTLLFYFYRMKGCDSN